MEHFHIFSKTMFVPLNSDLVFMIQIFNVCVAVAVCFHQVAWLSCFPSSCWLLPQLRLINLGWKSKRPTPVDQCQIVLSVTETLPLPYSCVDEPGVFSPSEVSNTDEPRSVLGFSARFTAVRLGITCPLYTLIIKVSIRDFPSPVCILGYAQV